MHVCLDSVHFQDNGLSVTIMQLQKGTTFDSAHDALQCIETFARANSHPLRKTNTVTVKEYNKKVWTCTQYVKID